MEKILISACLTGDKVRYDGNHNRIKDKRLDRWQEEGRLIPICPEVSGGLPVPRSPVEIAGGEGEGVLNRTAKIVTKEGLDFTGEFVRGAGSALSLARQHNIAIAILKERSPSCGSHFIYDGQFNRKLKTGMGVTARLLQKNGIRVFNEDQIDEVSSYLAGMEKRGS